MKCFYCGRTEEEIRESILNKIKETYTKKIKLAEQLGQFEKISDEALEGIKTNLKQLLAIIPKEMLEISVENLNKMKSFIMTTPLGGVVEQIETWSTSTKNTWAITQDITVASLIKNIISQENATIKNGVEAVVEERNEFEKIYSNCKLFKKTDIYINSIGQIYFESQEGIFKEVKIDINICKICEMKKSKEI